MLGTYEKLNNARRKIVEARSVIVIGAGIAGLAAARRLQEAGESVLVVEARSRIGGRIWTARDWGVPVELGASWIHGNGNNPLTGLCSRCGVETLPTGQDNVALFGADGQALAEVQTISAWRQAWGREFARLAKHIPEGEDRSITDILDERLTDPSLAPSARSTLRWSLTLSTLIEGADPEILSARQNVLVPSHPGGNRLVINGYDAIPKYLAQGLAIRLAELVVRICHDARGVQVETARETLEADYAIVTLPLGVLKAEAVRFDPELPVAKQRAIARLGMGVLDKVALRFSTAFWPAEPLAFGYLEPGAAFPVLFNGRYYQEAPVLIAFTAGTAARALEARSDAAIIAKAMAVVRRLFGATVPEPLSVRVTHAGPPTLTSSARIPIFRSGQVPLTTPPSPSQWASGCCLPARLRIRHLRPRSTARSAPESGKRIAFLTGTEQTFDSGASRERNAEFC